MNELKLSDLARSVLADVDTALRSGSKRGGVERGADTGRKLPTPFINPARRANNRDESTPSIERAADRKRGEE